MLEEGLMAPCKLLVSAAILMGYTVTYIYFSPYLLFLG